MPSTEVHCLLGERPARIYPVGELDLTCKDKLNAAIRAVADPPTGDIVVDLSATTFMDSTGLGFLARLSRRFSDSGHTMTVTGPTAPVMRVLLISGLDRIVTITP